MRRYAVKERPLVLEFESNDSPRHLWFILVSEDIGTQFEFAMRDHVWPHRTSIAFRTLWPALRRFSVHLQYQQRMMVGKIGARIVCMVLIFANSDCKIRVGMTGKRANQIFKQDSLNLGRPIEICVVADGVSDLRQREQILTSQIARRPGRHSVNITSNLKVGWQGARRLRFQNELGVMCSS